MKAMRHAYLFRLVVIFAVPFPLQAVTVKPCPTNKIAPHRRIMSWDRNQARTIGAFYDLLGPSSQQHSPPNSLQEPQIDDPDDCGDIEDYDESDIDSLTSPKRRQGVYNRLLFSGLHQPQPPYGQHPSSARPPVRPQRPTRPPYWSGGFFGNNPYRPPSQQYPSNDVKPVHDGKFETQMTYRPDVVGGPIGHVVGVTQVRPTRRPLFDATTQRAPNNFNYPTRPTPSYDNYNPTRPTQNYDNYNPTRPTQNYNNYPTRPAQNYNNYPTRPTQNYNNYPTRSTHYNNYPPNPTQNQVSFPLRPTQNNDNYPSRPTQNRADFPVRPTQAPAYATRRPRLRNLNYSTSVLGSFVDLLFK